VTRVLVVDDDPALRKLERLILEEEDFNIFEADNGIDAVSLIRNMDVDVVLLDRNMPGMDGYEVCRVIREEQGNYSLPVIMITGDDSPSAMTTSLKGYVSDVITKPFRPEELVARVCSSVQRFKENSNDSASYS